MSAAPILVDDDDLPIPPELATTWSVLKRGLREAPELRTGLGFTVVLSLTVVVANLITPILIQLIFDHGFVGGFRPRYVYGICGGALLLVVISYLGARSSGRRLVITSEQALANLRVRTFAHIHELSIAEQTKEKRGIFVARVTADVEALAKFTEWGGIAWILAVAQIVGTMALMLTYSWHLTLPIVLMVIPLLVIVAKLQAGFSSAYNLVRTRVGEMLSEVSESVMGAAVVRAYGLDETVHGRVSAPCHAAVPGADGRAQAGLNAVPHGGDVQRAGHHDGGRVGSVVRHASGD
jgi:ATP-binding cassette subfamily B protein